MNLIKKQTIGKIIFAGLVLRIALHQLGTLDLDFNTYMAWGRRLADQGFAGFYNSWSDYLPGYLYILWFLTKLKQILLISNNLLLYKLPSILADLGTGYLIYKIVMSLNDIKNKKSMAIIGSALYLFNPAIFANSTLWGQTDSLTAFFILLTLYLLGKNYLWSSVALSIGTLIKPQAAFIAPAVLLYIIKNKWKSKKIIYYILLGLGIFIIAFIPFSQGNFISFMIQRLKASSSQYPYTSVNAFNFWGIFGFWKSDMDGTVPANLIGYAIVMFLWVLQFIRLLREKSFNLYYFSSYLLLTSYLFLTRMHERHLFVVLAPLLVASVLNNGFLLIYGILSLIYLLNLRYSFVWINQDFKSIFSTDALSLISLAATAMLPLMLFINKKSFKLKQANKKEGKINLPNIHVPEKQRKIILATILLFSLLARLMFITKPERKYFDEVYHAFTAELVANGDPKAWEWWNPHPEGFAYEWTHPPLAKLGMAAGMLVFGQNPFGWRIPGVLLGVGAVYLIYLITKNLFKDELMALLASALFSLDGLPLVMSRIGMNDMYFLFFILLTFYWFLQEKHYAGAIALGLAAASKWSTAWMGPVLLMSHILLKRKFTFRYLWYAALPPVIYLLSYWQMFATGHGLDIFWGMQKQMWWYHTNLDATHNYQSQWWSWPLMLKPVWLYVDRDRPNLIANIYAMGNPVIFWGGFLSSLVAFYWALKKRIKKLALIVFSYFAFFVSWAGSPRIMFLYHYLPAVPFMTILLAFVLRKKINIMFPFLAAALIIFIYFYPQYTGIYIPKWLSESYYWFESWR